MHFGLISPLWHTCARQQGAAAAARLELTMRRASLTNGDLQHWRVGARTQVGRFLYNILLYGSLFALVGRFYKSGVNLRAHFVEFLVSVDFNSRTGEIFVVFFLLQQS